MDISRISEWLQVVGLFGVIASLIFVGLQMKQTQEIALSGVYQTRAVATVEHNASAVANPMYLSALAKLYMKDTSRLTAEEFFALEYKAGNDMTLQENNHYQYESGFLSEEQWQRNFAEMRCFFEHPFNQTLLDEWDFRASFRMVIDDAREQAMSDPRGCWKPALGFPGPE